MLIKSSRWDDTGHKRKNSTNFWQLKSETSKTALRYIRFLQKQLKNFAIKTTKKLWGTEVGKINDGKLTKEYDCARRNELTAYLTVRKIKLRNAEK